MGKLVATFLTGPKNNWGTEQRIRRVGGKARDEEGQRQSLLATLATRTIFASDLYWRLCLLLPHCQFCRSTILDKLYYRLLSPVFFPVRGDRTFGTICAAAEEQNPARKCPIKPPGES